MEQAHKSESGGAFKSSDEKCLIGSLHEKHWKLPDFPLHRLIRIQGKDKHINLGHMISKCVALDEQLHGSGKLDELKMLCRSMLQAAS